MDSKMNIYSSVVLKTYDKKGEGVAFGNLQRLQIYVRETMFFNTQR
jgi:hypothetical protein